MYFNVSKKTPVNEIRLVFSAMLDELFIYTILPLVGWQKRSVLNMYLNLGDFTYLTMI